MGRARAELERLRPRGRRRDDRARSVRSVQKPTNAPRTRAAPLATPRRRTARAHLPRIAASADRRTVRRRRRRRARGVLGEAAAPSNFQPEVPRGDARCSISKRVVGLGLGLVVGRRRRGRLAGGAGARVDGLVLHDGRDGRRARPGRVGVGRRVRGGGRGRRAARRRERPRPAAHAVGGGVRRLGRDPRRPAGEEIALLADGDGGARLRGDPRRAPRLGRVPPPHRRGGAAVRPRRRRPRLCGRAGNRARTPPLTSALASRTSPTSPPATPRPSRCSRRSTRPPSSRPP